MMSHRLGTIHAWLGPGETRDTMRDVVERAGRSIVFVDDRELGEGIAGVEVLLAGVAPRVDWARAARLVLVQVLGSGSESFAALEGLPDRVQIANARGLHVPEMRDHALAMILAFERELLQFGEDQRARVYRHVPVGSVQGKTVCVLGLGEAGRAVAQACAALGMRVTSARASAPYDLHALLAEADYVVVTLPLTPRTRGLIDARALAAMKPGAVLVHMSRGGVVDEEALVAALRSNALRGAALDVFAREPLPDSSPLWTTPRLLITPHVAGFSHDYAERLARLTLENVARVERGEAPATLLPRGRGY